MRKGFRMRIEDEIKQKQFRNEYDKLIINLLYTGGWVNANNSRQLKPYRVSVQQYNILRILRGQHPNPATVNLLKERMLDKMSNASRLVEKLRVKGLVERRICEHDRRAVDVIITQKGLDLLAEIDALLNSWEEQFKALTPEEASTLNSLLDKLRG
jgi:DNA-binding MarR family transcriptional regulator